jgi:hypothetical protein
MTASEYYTTQFYTWEYRGRGYYIADTPIQLEPPFIPFFRHGYHTEQIDEGKKHTWISSLVESIKGKKKIIINEQEPLDYQTIEPFKDEELNDNIALQIKIPKDRKVSTQNMKALLTMLSYKGGNIAFEIIGTDKEIIIQFVSAIGTIPIIGTYLKAYFPNFAIIQNDSYLDNLIQEDLAIAVVDYGLKNEFIWPIQIAKSFSFDPLMSVLAVLEQLREGERAGVQMLFNTAYNEWTESIIRSVTLYDGTSFFIDVPEAPKIAQEKIQSPLFGVSIRSFAQAKELEKAFAILNNISVGIVEGSKGMHNQLIPLVHQEYDFNTRVSDIILRQSHRLGMILNTDELITLLHFPSESIHSQKLFASKRKTKEVPSIAKDKEYILGENIHNGIKEQVSISIEDRLKHTHIIGATGTGKSTLLSNLILQDIDKGLGLVLFDPHGDLVEDTIARIPKERVKDIVLLDPSDIDYPIGLNILEAHSDVEKEVLSSDLVAAFRKYSTSWGDQMSTVLGNAILAILEHKDGGTLHDLRRLLIEKDFRYSFIKEVKDPAVKYYWLKEYPLLKTNSIGPILTRLDTFLRPKSIRNMLIQKKGLDFESLLNSNKIILFKLSQGLIGVENSFLLGTLLLSKIHQAIIKRQNQVNRKPIFIYLDEFQNFITPSIKEMISGIRKYNAGLTISHQDLHQIQEAELMTSVLGNINTRIVFRVGEPDAKKLQEGFSGFDYTDLQNLGRGEAIIKIEQPKYDCSLDTIALDTVSIETKEEQIQLALENTRANYAKPKAEVEQLFWDSLKYDAKNEEEQEITKPKSKEQKLEPIKEIRKGINEEQPNKQEEITQIIKSTITTKPQKEIQETKEDKQPSTHRYLQMLVKKMAEARGYTATIEQQIKDSDGQVDVLLTKENKTIAIEISVTTEADWEVHNIEKCLKANYDTVISLSGDPKQLDRIKKKCAETITGFANKPVLFYTPDALFTFLDTANKTAQKEEQVIKGYRVNVSYDNITQEEMERKRASIAKVVVESMRKQRKK